MSSRTIANGSDFMCFVKAGVAPAVTYRPLAGQTGCTLQRGANYIETSNKNLGGTKDFFPGIKDWNATVEIDVTSPADVNADEVSKEELEDMEVAGTKPIFVFCWVTITAGEPEPDITKRMYEGPGLVSCPTNAPAAEKMTSSVAIQGCRELEIIDPV